MKTLLQAGRNKCVSVPARKAISYQLEAV